MACRKQFPAEMATPQTQPRRYMNVSFIITSVCKKASSVLFIPGFTDCRPNAGDERRAERGGGGMIESIIFNTLFQSGRALMIGCWVIEQLHLSVCVRRA